MGSIIPFSCLLAPCSYRTKSRHVTMGFVLNAHAPSSSSDPHRPAYDGAKFDARGHCLKHPHIIMCKPKKSSGMKEETNTRPGCKYVIVRKTCHLCGEHALRNERKLNKKSWVHGNERTKFSPKGLVGTDNHAKTSSGHTSSGHSGVRTTKRNGGRNVKISPSSPSRRSPCSTPPTTPESVGSRKRNLEGELAGRVPPPPLPDRETRRTVRRRLQGTIPPGPTIDIHCSRSRGKSQTRRSGTSHNDMTSDEHSSDNSVGSRTERRPNRKRSKSSYCCPVSILRLDRLRV